MGGWVIALFTIAYYSCSEKFWVPAFYLWQMKNILIIVQTCSFSGWRFFVVVVDKMLFCCACLKAHVPNGITKRTWCKQWHKKKGTQIGNLCKVYLKCAHVSKVTEWGIRDLRKSRKEDSFNETNEHWQKDCNFTQLNWQFLTKFLLNVFNSVDYTYDINWFTRTSWWWFVIFFNNFGILTEEAEISKIMLHSLIKMNSNFRIFLKYLLKVVRKMYFLLSSKFSLDRPIEISISRCIRMLIEKVFSCYVWHMLKNISDEEANAR